LTFCIRQIGQVTIVCDGGYPSTLARRKQRKLLGVENY
jgi:hypothetical protein